MAEAVAAANCADSRDLHAWSVARPDEFWDLMWRQCGVVGDRGDGPAVASGGSIRDDRYFPNAGLNYAENLLAGGQRPGAGPLPSSRDVRTVAAPNGPGDNSRSRRRPCQRWLRSVGVGPGDHVAAWMPNTVETLVAMLATSALGAVFTSTSPDFGVAGVVDRFSQVDPVVLVAADGYHYGGKAHDRARLLPDVVAQLPSLRAVVTVPELGIPVPALPVPRVQWGDGWDVGASPQFERRNPSQPGFVLYSSGTTGRPKCIVHSGAGVLLKQLTEHQLHCDIHPGDRVFYFTTCGWMMWNWLVTALASGATIVLFDGSPFSSRPRGDVGLGQPGAGDAVRHECEVPGFVAQSRRHAGGHPRAIGVADDHLDGFALVGGRVRLRVSRRQTRRPPGIDQWGYRPVWVFRDR
jgi:acetoacetyl-CoA synthetase